MKKKCLAIGITILVLSLISNIFLVTSLLFSKMEIGLGGNMLVSPNGRYEAYLNHFVKNENIFIPGHWRNKHFYRFVIYDVRDKSNDAIFRYEENLVNCVDLEILHWKENLKLDRSSDYIEWSLGSSEVTYSFEDIELKLKLNERESENIQQD